jgi:hypothetical protein
MKCFRHHPIDAVGICANCGRALCSDCIPTSTASRVACSSDCASELAANTRALRLLLEKSTQSARASAFYCYLTGGLSAAAAVAAWFMLPSPFLIYFTGGCALALFAAGFWHGRVAGKDHSSGRSYDQKKEDLPR